MEPATKICTKCKQEKPANQFSKNKERPSGLACWCKQCVSAACREYYIKNRAAINARHKQWRENNPEKCREKSKRDWCENWEMRKAAHNAWRRANRARFRHLTRNGNLKRTYGITQEQYNLMLAAQGGVCAICKRPPPATRLLDVDHCHTTGKVRALLCIPCNHKVGAVESTRFPIENYIAYVQHHKQKQEGMQCSSTPKIS